MRPGDIDKLKDELKDYYGTAISSFGVGPLIDMIKVDAMDDEEVVERAREAGIL